MRICEMIQAASDAENLLGEGEAHSAQCREGEQGAEKKKNKRRKKISAS